MNSAELLRKLKKLAKSQGLALTVTPAKGSHQKVHLDKRMTVIPIHGSELKTGLLRGILKDLGIKEQDL